MKYNRFEELPSWNAAMDLSVRVVVRRGREEFLEELKEVRARH